MSASSMRPPVDPLFQFLLSTMGGVFVFLFFVARDYLRSVGLMQPLGRE